MHARSLAIAVAITAALAACKPAEAPAPATPVAETAPAATPEPAPAAKIEPMRAFGNEPFWEMIDDGSGTLLFSTPDKSEGERYPATRSDDAAGIHYAGTDVKLDIVKKDCSDGMSDGTNPYTATMTLKGKTYSGCAAPASDVMPVEDGADAATPAGAQGKRAAGDTGEPMGVFRAFGNEPFWSVNVEGDTLTYTTPDVQKGIKLSGTRSAFAKGLEITGTHEGKPFTLVVKGGDCSDGMSDNTYTQTATFSFQGRTLKGCAEEAK